MALILAQDYIYHALRQCGQLKAGYTAQLELLTDAIDQWHLLFDSYNSRRTMMYTMPDYVFPILGPGHGVTGNAQTFGGSGYQIGPTSLDFVAPRPEAIVRVNLYYTEGPSPARIPLSQISMEQWMNIAVVSLPAINVATTFAYDPQYPNGVIWVWPPLNGNSLEIFTWGALTPPASLTAPFSAPPGYADLIVKQLAVRLWQYCSVSWFKERHSFEWISAQAELARQQVAKVNAPMPRLRNDFSGGRMRITATSDWGLLLTGVSSS